jgi:hypothetical protein
MNEIKNKNGIIHGLLAEFGNPADLLAAAAGVREAGYRKFDCHSPFPIHGMDQAMGLRRSPLGYIVFAVAAVALAAGVALEWWTSTVDYPLVISGKPFFSYQAYGPVAFAIMVLTSSFAALIGMLVLNRLPRFFHKLFYSRNLGKAMDDGFFVSVDSTDPNFDLQQTKNFLNSIGAKNIEVIQEE